MKIREKILNNESYYLKEYISTTKQHCHEEKINIIKSIVKKDDFEYILVYDKKMNVIRGVYSYLNIELRDLAFNSRDSIATALKLFYSFIEIFNFDINELDYKCIVAFKEFLYGVSRKGRNYEFELITLRSINTVNKYLAVCRNYLNYLGIKNEVLNEKRILRVEKGNEGLLGHTRKKTYEKYTIHDKANLNKRTVPMYIKKSEFHAILNSIENKYSIREEIIVRLMYENGMRIGEVLGLTLEDIQEKNIIIRNRLSDKADQSAKTCFKVKSEQDYLHSTYDTWSIGYHIIKPTLYLMDKIYEYIDITHGRMSKKNRKNYIENAKADKTTKDEMLEGDNYYLFLNKDRKPLRAVGWNKILRKIFEEVGLIIDKNVKVHNLNHRFRHGFAMKRIKEGASAVEVASDLRHTGISSVMCYFRPTEEEVYDANKFGAESIMKNMPFIITNEED